MYDEDLNVYVDPIFEFDRNTRIIKYKKIAEINIFKLYFNKTVLKFGSLEIIKVTKSKNANAINNSPTLNPKMYIPTKDLESNSVIKKYSKII